MNDTAQPVPLSAQEHGALRLRDGARLDFAATQHVVLVRAAEIGAAAASFPIFLNRHGSSGAWLFSAMTSFEPGENWFVVDGRWDGSFWPSFLQTYPFVLLPNESAGSALVLGVSPDSSAFSSDTGVALFDDSGRLAVEVRQVEQLLRSDLDKDAQSRGFAQTLLERRLNKAIDIVVSRRSGRSQTIRGLQTIDEEALRALDDDAIVDLNRRGYLMVMHAMLLSMGQLNALVRRSAARDADPVTRVRIEVARDHGSAEPIPR